MDPMEDRVRRSLRERAGDAEPTPELYGRVQARVRRRSSWRVRSVAVAGVAAVAAAAVVVPQLAAQTPATPPIADQPPTTLEDGVPPADVAFDPLLPDVALLGRADASIVLQHLTDGSDPEEVVPAGGLTSGASEVVDISVAPGSSPDRFRAVAARVRADGPSEVVAIDATGPDAARWASTSDQRITSSSAPEIVISPDGERLAVLEAAGAGLVELRVVTPDFGTEEGGEVTAGSWAVDVVDTIEGDRLLAWSGDASSDETVLTVASVAGEVTAHVVRETAEGFELDGEVPAGGGDPADPDGAGPSDLAWTAQLPGSPDDPVVRVGGRDHPGPALSYRSADGDFGVVPASAIAPGEGILVEPGARLVFDARGRQVLYGDGERAIVLTVDDEPAAGSAAAEPGADEDAASAFAVTAELEDVAAGALLGGYATAQDVGGDDGGAVTPEGDGGTGEPADGPATAELDAAQVLVGGAVVADPRTVSLVAEGGEVTELYTFPAEGASEIVDVAVRPGSTSDDLTVAVTTVAEGQFDVRYLRAVDGVPVAENGQEALADLGFPTANLPDPADGAAPVPVWSPDGAHLAWSANGADVGDAVGAVTIVAWGEDAPLPPTSDTPGGTFPVERSVELRRWLAPLDDDETGGGEVDAGTLVFVDPLGGAVATCPVRELPDVRVSPDCTAVTPVDVAGADEDGVLDVAATAGATDPDVVLRSGASGASVAVGTGDDAVVIDVPLDPYAGSGGRSALAVAGELVVGRLQGGPVFAVDPSTGAVAEVPDLPGDTIAFAPLPG